MAGSYGHLIDDAGYFRKDEEGNLDMSLLENEGDFREAVEQMAGMILYLAPYNYNARTPDFSVVKEASRDYKQGLRWGGLYTE